MAANQSMKGQERQNGKGGYLIPPLPQSKPSLDKEKARSPLGKGAGSKNDAPRSFSSSNSNNQTSMPLRKEFTEKSNQENLHNGTRGALAPLPFAKNIIRNRDQATTKALAEKQKSPSFLLPSSLKHAPKKNSTHRRVLRYRESMESLFCLTKESSDEYRQLCIDIVEGGLADDAATWRRVLELASEQERRLCNSSNQYSVGAFSL